MNPLSEEHLTEAARFHDYRYASNPLADGTLRFFHNDRALGALNDERLRRAFFSIWLDPRTSAPDLRRKLLGDSGQR